MNHKYTVVAFKSSKYLGWHRWYWLPNARSKAGCEKSIYLKAALNNNQPIYFFTSLVEMRKCLSDEYPNGKTFSIVV